MCSSCFLCRVTMFIVKCSYCVALRGQEVVYRNSDALKPRLDVDVLAWCESFYDHMLTRGSFVWVSSLRKYAWAICCYYVIWLQWKKTESNEYHRMNPFWTQDTFQWLWGILQEYESSSPTKAKRSQDDRLIPPHLVTSWILGIRWIAALLLMSEIITESPWS
jgi:hypothetical protein